MPQLRRRRRHRAEAESVRRADAATVVACSTTTDRVRRWLERVGARTMPALADIGSA